jgi:AP-1 complex subunit beta-1
MRALAVRTMGCIRVERITEYLCESLKDCLTDEDPYVKKTAALAVAKLFQTSPRLVKDHSLVKIVQGMLLDGNASVVANACASLLEVSRASGKNYLRIKSGGGGNLNKILAALNDSNEWGKIYIMEGISSSFDTSDTKEAEHIIERVLPMLTHNNPAVILSAVKAILKFQDVLPTAGDLSKQVVKKLSAPLVTLLSCEPELQYVALRNINFILQKHPSIFEQNVRVFFCKFNDPVYVKLEKIDILVKVADDKNADVILNELREYANDIELELIRKSIRAIGTIILRVDKSAKRAVEILQEIVTTGQPLCLQEAVIVAKDIFRKFPNKYEALIKDLCAKLPEYYEPDARASIVWIIGEYAEKILDSEKLIDSFADSFLEDPDKVRLQTLTAAVKLFLKKPEEGEDVIQRILKLATEEVENPDLRDRAYIYWRMLSSSP